MNSEKKNIIDLRNQTSLIIHVDTDKFLISANLISSPIIMIYDENKKINVETRNTMYICNLSTRHEIWNKIKFEQLRKSLQKKLAYLK